MRPITLFWVLAAQAIGGATPALTKLALEGIGPWSLVVGRQILGTLFLVGLARLGARVRGGGPPPFAPWSRSDKALLLALAWGGFALPLVLNALGLERSSATHGALLSPLEPVGILLGGALLLGEPITATRASAVILGIVGATLIVAPSGASEGSDLFGDVLMALGHLSWAIYTLAAKPLVARHDPLVVAIWGGFLSWLPILPLALREPWDTARAIPALGWVALLAFLASGVLTFAWNRALREISAGTMAAFIFVQPVVGLVIGVSALGESVGAWAILGAMLILAGVTLATLRGES